MRWVRPMVLVKMFILICLCVVPASLFAQAYQGYTLYSPFGSNSTYLINMNNTIVKSWTHTRSGGYSSYLLPDGSVLRTALSSGSPLNGGGAQGVVQRVAWNGTLLWEYTYSSSTYRAHHDIEPMPNGNVLIIAWEVKTPAECIAAGLNHSATLWPDHVIEVQPVGTNGGIIVWRWHAWDHLIQDFDPTKNNYGVVRDHPELLDINYRSTSGDWMHLNGISYNPDLDQIVLSSHFLNELYVIDHSTTIQEAAGHTGGRWGRGGDYLYRWGNPAAYRAPGAQVFNVVHCAIWIPDSLPGGGHLMAFNNREGQGTSMIVEIVPPVDSLGNYIWVPGTAYGPSAPIWSYTASNFYANHLGGVQRLPNGNTLIAQSTTGRLFEVTSAGTVVWNYQTSGQIPRALRYAPTYPGLSALFPARFVLSTRSLFFGDVEVLSSRRDSLVVRNPGTATLTISSITNSNMTQFTVTPAAPISVPAGDSTFIYVTFRPTIVGLHRGRIAFAHNGATSPDTVLVEGTGQPTTSVVPKSDVPGEYALMQNYPNPFSASGGNPSTTIKFQIPNVTPQTTVTLKVYDVLGREVATLMNEALKAGSYETTFDATGLGSGIYLYRMTADDFVAVRKFVVLK